MSLDDDVTPNQQTNKPKTNKTNKTKQNKTKTKNHLILIRLQ